MKSLMLLLILFGLFGLKLFAQEQIVGDLKVQGNKKQKHLL